MMKPYSICLLLVFQIVLVRSTPGETSAEKVYDIRTYGAVGDGETPDTDAIQAAIDCCTESGGGRVFVPDGTFLSGTIFLKDNVTLYLSPGAVLKGSPKFEDYIKARSLVTAQKAVNVGIEGHGTINGNGGHENFRSEDIYNGLKGRPHLARFEDCVDVHVRDFKALDSVAWTMSFFRCDRVSIDGVYVCSRVNANNDGIDIVDCHDTRISNCLVDAADDGIVMKSTSKRLVKRLAITNCLVKSECNAIKFGTETLGGFEDVTVSNCVVTDTRLSGVALEIVDGGRMERVVIDNIAMNNVNGSILIKLGLRKGESPVLRDVSLSNIVADGLGSFAVDQEKAHFPEAKDSRVGVCIMGQPGFPLENITLRNISLRFAGDCEKQDADIADFIDRRPKGYPEYTNFGITPAYGINCRHVRGLNLENVSLDIRKDDPRSAVHLQDVETVRLDAFRARVVEGAPAFVRIKDSKDVFISGCKPGASEVPFLSFEGENDDIAIMNNDLSKLKNDHRIAEGSATSNIRRMNNFEPVGHSNKHVEK